MEVKRFKIILNLFGVLIFSPLILGIYEEIYENYEKIIYCYSRNERIKINSATWQYDRTNPINYITPNWRNVMFFPGPNLGIGVWDVAEVPYIKNCNGRKSCTLRPTNDNLGSGTIHRMFLKLDFSCMPVCIGNPSVHRSKRQIPNQVCVPSSFDGILDILESLYETRSYPNFGAVTSVTLNTLRHRDGRGVNLVHVMRAMITINTLQSRESYPSGIAARMRELNNETWDERGHLLASTLGGPSSVFNIVPQYCCLNRVVTSGELSPWFELEGRIRNEIRNNPTTFVDWVVIVRYNNPEVTDNFRPIGFGLRVTFYRRNQAAETEEHYFNNLQHVLSIDEMPENWFNP